MKSTCQPSKADLRHVPAHSGRKPAILYGPFALTDSYCRTDTETYCAYLDNGATCRPERITELATTTFMRSGLANLRSVAQHVPNQVTIYLTSGQPIRTSGYVYIHMTYQPLTTQQVEIHDVNHHGWQLQRSTSANEESRRRCAARRWTCIHGNRCAIQGAPCNRSDIQAGVSFLVPDRLTEQLCVS